MMRKLAEWLFSINPVLIGMLSIIVYLMLETTALLHQVLPKFVVAGWFRWALSAFLSVSFHLTVLNISVNSEIINRWFAVIVAVMAVLLTMYFFQVFSLEGIAMYQSITFSAIVGFCGYSYVFLFVEKYKRMLNEEDKATKIDRLKAEKDSLESEIQAHVEAEKRLSSVNESLTEKLKETRIQTNESAQLKLSINSGSKAAVNGADSVNCDFCSRQFNTRKDFSNRKGYCKRKAPEQCKRNKQPAHETQEA